MKIDLSIIVPFYNAENFLHLPINSLKEQTYSNFEVILVNDGSTDHSFEVAEKLIGGDTRFTILDQINLGPGAARNFGISVAKGEYVGFIDSDDYFDKNFVQLMLENAVHENADIVICEIVKVDVNGCVLKHYPVAFEKPIGRMEAFSDIMQSINISSNTQNKIFRRELFRNVEFPDYIRVNEDSATVYRLILGADIISFVNIPLFYYVQHKGSSMNSFDYSKLNDRFKVASMIKTFMSENSLSDLMHLHDIYYLQNVALSGSLQIARFSRNYHNDIHDFLKRLDKSIFTYSKIFKIAKSSKSKFLALAVLKINRSSFRVFTKIQAVVK